MADLPSGTVTFLFTDIEGSTKLLHELGPEAYATALAEHRRLLRAAFDAHGGVEVDTEGDAFFVAFTEASAGLAAAADAQSALRAGPIRVRMGLHTGAPHRTADGYVGEDVHLGARIAAAGHGGQVLLSGATAQAVGPGRHTTDLGEHRLKDFPQPIPIFQLGDERFPPLKTISNTNLPRPASSFVGREQEVDEVTALLRDGARLLTLTGPGGTGKTRLSIEAASELIPEFKAGVFWVPLASLRDSTLVSDTIATTLGAKDGLADHIGEREMLLLIDNLEQVIAAAPELATLVESCPNLRVLTTSRETLRVRGEVEYSVPPLADPDAVELFSERSGLPTDETIQDLCRRLENLPLAVELAAARARVLTPAQILDRLSRRLDLLKGGRDADPRQQTLRAAIEWSYDLLDDEEKELFARLAAFAGGATLEAAEKVVDADLDSLQALVDKSLVRHSGDRFWMLETIREFALERLDSSGAGPRLRQRHASYFLDLSEEYEMKLFGPHSDDSIDSLERDHDNLRAAIDHFKSTGAIQDALRLSGAIAEFWNQRAHHAEAFRRYVELLDADPNPTRARAKALDGAAMMATMSGRQQVAIEWEEEALRLYREFEDKRGTALALCGLGYLRIEDGEYATARQMLHEAIQLLSEIGDEVTRAWATRTLAFSYWRAGEHARARPIYEEALKRAQEIDDPALQAHLFGVLSEYAIDDGRGVDAARLALESLGKLKPAGDPLLALARLSSVARVMCSLGRPGVGARLLAYADARNEEIGAREIWVGVEAQQTLSMIRQTLDNASFASAWEEGRTLSPAAAMDLAISELKDAIERQRASI